jgi:glucuronate isomerase
MKTVEATSQSFITDNFLLKNKFAETLYHNYASSLPIIDYHCHLSPADLANNRKFENISSIWLEGDHYKWRAMRTLGIDEGYITGDKTAKEKFDKWAYTVPYTLRNPLYHWTHLELKRYYQIDSLLNPDTAERIFEDTSAQLQQDSFSARGIVKKMNVEVICTTDDPADSLEYHKKLKADNFSVDVRPAFRPDKTYAVESESYTSYLDLLSRVSGIEINSFESLLSALSNRIDYFHTNGCQLSDHGLENLYFPPDDVVFDTEVLFQKAQSKKALSQAEAQCFRYTVLIELGRMYHKKGWTQQFHLGALRNTNSRMMSTLGPDTGFDSIGDFSQASAVAQFLNKLDSTNQLAKTILYNLNPSDNEVMGTMIGNFNDGSIKGKIQFGSAWWFLDQKDGMEKQINALSNLGLLSCFIGMLTDSRSFMSYPRHEYFRRILCNLIGQDVENGELPKDEKWLGKIVSYICYHNAKAYFNFQAY